METDEFLILVDDNDLQWGKLEKSLVHELGLLHRAFSIFIFNTNGELLLQKRAEHKYHSGGLWTNTCCSHPRFGEDLEFATARRLMEEMGLTCEIEKAFSFIYKAEFENGLKEHEFDHVFIGLSDTPPIINRAEVKTWKYMSIGAINAELILFPENYTAWFKICFEKVALYYNDFVKVKI